MSTHLLVENSRREAVLVNMSGNCLTDSPPEAVLYGGNGSGKSGKILYHFLGISSGESSILSKTIESSIVYLGIFYLSKVGDVTRPSHTKPRSKSLLAFLQNIRDF